MAKKKTSFSLSPQALELLAKVAEHKGLSGASTIETLIREKSEQLGITLDSK